MSLIPPMKGMIRLIDKELTHIPFHSNCLFMPNQLMLYIWEYHFDAWHCMDWVYSLPSKPTLFPNLPFSSTLFISFIALPSVPSPLLLSSRYSVPSPLLPFLDTLFSYSFYLISKRLAGSLSCLRDSTFSYINIIFRSLKPFGIMSFYSWFKAMPSTDRSRPSYSYWSPSSSYNYYWT